MLRSLFVFYSNYSPFSAILNTVSLNISKRKSINCLDKNPITELKELKKTPIKNISVRRIFISHSK